MLLWLIYVLIAIIIIVILLKFLFNILVIAPYGIHEDAVVINSLIHGIRPL